MSTEPKRKDAKKAVVARDQEDHELNQVLSEAQKAQLQLAKQKSDHALEMRKMDLGKLGVFFGDGRNTATFIAFTCILLSFGCLTFIDNADSNKYISIITLALGYIFGKKTSGD